MGGKRANRKRFKSANARAWQKYRTYQGLYYRDEKKPWEFEHRGRLTEEQKASHPVQKRDYPYQEYNESFWVNDLECPYTEVKKDLTGIEVFTWVENL